MMVPSPWCGYVCTFFAPVPAEADRILLMLCFLDFLSHSYTYWALSGAISVHFRPLSTLLVLSLLFIVCNLALMGNSCLLKQCVTMGLCLLLWQELHHHT